MVTILNLDRKFNMKKITLLVSLILGYMAFAVCAYAKTTTQPLDKIVAIVNDDVITQSEFEHGLVMAKAQISQEGLATPPTNVLNTQVRNQLINKKLQLQIAKQAGITVTDAELDKVIQSIAQQNQLSANELYDRLHQEGLSTTDYRNEMRSQITLQRLQQQEVVNHVTVSQDEINNFLHSKLWQMNGVNEYHLEDILVPFSEAPSIEEITASQQRAETILTKLHSGQSFQAVVQAESGGKDALQGGDLGWRKLPEIPSAFAAQVGHMKTDEIAGPIQAANGFHIIRIAGIRAAAKQAAPSRKQVEEMLLQRKFEEAVQTWVSKLRGQAFIVVTKA
jgi:peptidyl-prolyl cis-trans isomerase SurA